MIRQAYKTALGLPTATATHKLLALGVHNTWEELQEAHHSAQLRRLQLTPTGRQVLTALGLRPIPPREQKQRIPLALRDGIRVAPIPRNMHANYHLGRRAARARALTARYGEDPSALHTDATRYPGRAGHVACVVTHTGQCVTAATILPQAQSMSPKK